MPRVELKPWDVKETDDGWPTVDVCRDCHEIFIDSPVVSSDDCEHPPYEDDEYSCRECGVLLTNDDN